MPERRQRKSGCRDQGEKFTETPRERTLGVTVGMTIQRREKIDKNRFIEAVLMGKEGKKGEGEKERQRKGEGGRGPKEKGSKILNSLVSMEEIREAERLAAKGGSAGGSG